jgi:coenzyme PQQ biosynthesis protein PqqD
MSNPKLAKKARLRFDRHSGKHMIVYPERGLELNDSAAAIAKKLDGTRDESAIVEEIVREHEGNADDVRRDVSAFLSELRAKGLLE